MATDTRKKQRRTAGKRQQQTVKVQDYVAEKLNVTRRQVRQVDVMSNMITLVSIVMVFLLAVAIIDAWIMPMGTLGRWAGFLTLVLGTLAFLGLVIGRSLVRKVNPDYAAQMIEESQPGFKNSLLNYVSLSRKPQGTKAAVMDAVSRQAATDISTVPVEALVDRSAMIRVSLILAGIIFFGAIYTLFSPKNPFQSMARVVFPSAKLAPPSVVTIKDVKPGDAEAFFGDEVEVSALVVGRHDPQDVKLIFSTKDGQIVDRVLPMTLDSGTTDRYVASLSTDGSGIQQALTYHIVARDGVTPEFSIDVRTNPSIAIEQVSLEPPTYSKLEPWQQPQGTIEALEGTRVTINAKANLPIKSAEIELLNLNDKGDFVTARKVLMNTQPDNLQHSVGSFNIEMNKRRTRQAATHYRLNFVSTEGHKNLQPNNFPIKVIPDLAPEIKVLNPLEKAISLPIDVSKTIRIQATDADFEISKIELEFQHNEQRIFGQPLQLQPVQEMQRVIGDFELNVSRQFPLLKVGDQLVFHATAHDNRRTSSGRVAANETQTENYVIEIAEPVNQPRDDQDERNRDPNQQQREQQRQQEPQQDQDPRDPEDEKEQQQNRAPMDREQDQREPDAGDQDQQQPGDRQDPNRQDQQDQRGNDPNQQREGDQQQNSDDGQQGDQRGDGDQRQNGQENQPGDQGDGQQQDGTQPGQREQQWQEGQGNQQPRDGEGAPEQNENGQPGNQDPNSQGSDPGPENDAERIKRLNEMFGNNEEQNQGENQERQQGNEQLEQEQQEQGQQPEIEQGGNPQNGEPQPGQNGDPQKGQQGNPQEGQPQQGQNGDPQQGQNGDPQKGQQGNPQDSQSQQGQNGDPQRGQKQDGDQSPNRGQGTGEPQGDQPSQDGNTPQQQENQQSSQGEENGTAQGSSGSDPGAESKNGAPAEESAEGQRSGDKGEQSGQGEGQGKGEGEGQGKGEGEGQGKGQGEGQGKGQGEGQGQGKGQGNGGGDQQQGGGQGGSGGGAGGPDEAQIAEEEANMEFSKKATDMILQRLKKQRNNPDQELLDAMNWTKDDMNRFIDRWQKMQEAAARGNDADKKRFEKHLKGLGLRPSGAKSKSRLKGDGKEDYLEDSAVDRIMPELRSEYQAFQRELNRSR